MSSPVDKMASSVDLSDGAATRTKVPRLKVSAPPKQEISRTHSGSAGVSATPSTISPILLIRQTKNLDRNRYHNPLGYDPGVFNARLKA